MKPPTGQSAAYTQAAADDLHQMGLTVLTQSTFFGKATGRRSERTTMAVVAQANDRGLVAGSHGCTKCNLRKLASFRASSKWRQQDSAQFLRPYVNAALLLAQGGPISVRCTSLLLGAIEAP